MDTKKEVHDILAACESREQLRAAMHKHWNFSVDEARALTRKWFPVTAAKDANGEISRTSVARAFRSAKEKQDARMQFLRDVVSDAAKAEARQTPDGYTSFMNGWGLKAKREELYDSTILQRIHDRLAGELAAELGECKDRDALQAKLITLGWKNAEISEYMEEFA